MADVELGRSKSFRKKSEMPLPMPPVQQDESELAEDENQYIESLFQNITKLKESNTSSEKTIKALLEDKKNLSEKIENETLLFKRLEAELEKERSNNKNHEEKISAENARRENLKQTFMREIEIEKTEQLSLIKKLELSASQKQEISEKLQEILEFLKSNNPNSTNSKQKNIIMKSSISKSFSDISKSILRSKEMDQNEEQ